MHVPVWHEKTREARSSGDLQMLGIVQEQHPDRAALFRQWKQFDWPILVDSYNLLQVPYVPIFLALDEHAVIRQIIPMGMGSIDEFLSTEYPAPNHEIEPRRLATLPNHPDEAIASLRASIEKNEVPSEPDGWAHFRLGVAYRLRYDSAARKAHDFSRAVEHWSLALEMDPNNYIWRRRLQQYGPRLAKPYPFYDWIVQARQEIGERGETPLALRAEPGASEFARPLQNLPGAGTPQKDQPQSPASGGAAVRSGVNRDPKNRIHQDPGELVEIRTTVVPHRIPAGEPIRLYVHLVPRQEAHWNNEVAPTYVWIEADDGWQMERQAFELAHPSEALSREMRHFEVEIDTPENDSTSARLRAYALYYVCEDAQGTCLYRRQDFEIPVEFTASQKLGGR